MANTHYSNQHNINQSCNNMLACYPAILKRLQTVHGIKKVAEAQELSLLTGKKQRPDDNTLYVVFDGFTPINPNNENSEQLIRLGFSMILAKRNYTLKPETDDVGHVLTAIMQAMQGFDSVDADGDNIVVTPFVQATPLPIRYEDGYAFFSTRFTTDVVVMVDDELTSS